MEEVAVASDGIRNSRVSDRTLVQMNPLGVEPQAPILDEVPVASSPQFSSIAEAAKDLRAAHIDLEGFGNDHG